MSIFGFDKNVLASFFIIILGGLAAYLLPSDQTMKAFGLNVLGGFVAAHAYNLLSSHNDHTNS